MDEVLLLNAREVRELYPMSAAVDVVERAFGDFALGRRWASMRCRTASM